jgi:hypothetical protein
MYIGTYERAKAGTERRTRRDRAKGKATARAHSGSPAIVILDGFKEVEPKMRERTIAVEVVHTRGDDYTGRVLITLETVSDTSVHLDGW